MCAWVEGWIPEKYDPRSVRVVCERTMTKLGPTIAVRMMDSTHPGHLRPLAMEMIDEVSKKWPVLLIPPSSSTRYVVGTPDISRRVLELGLPAQTAQRCRDLRWEDSELGDND